MGLIPQRQTARWRDARRLCLWARQQPPSPWHPPMQAHRLAQSVSHPLALHLPLGQADLACDAPHFRLVQLAHGEQGLGQLRLAKTLQKVVLVLDRPQPLEQPTSLKYDTGCRSPSH